MNGEQKYNEALERARKEYKTHESFNGFRVMLLHIFPELKEPEDEKIRKDLISFLDDIWHLGKNANFDKWGKSDCSNWITWLEKQGRQEEETPIEDTETTVKKETKPKFKVGDWVVKADGTTFSNGKRCTYIYRIEDDRHYCDTGTWSYPDTLRLWTIADAKDGDVLSSKDNFPFIYNGTYDNELVGAYIGIDTQGEIITSNEDCNWIENIGIRPATIEQHLHLFDEIRKTGYYWNKEHKELKKI